jgi:CBS domain-containing protein
MPTAGQFCNRRVATARPNETLHDVAARMRGEHIGSIVVVDKQHGQVFPIGLLTDRDIVVAVLAQKDQRVDTIIVGDVMSTEPVMAPENEDLLDVLNRMQSAGVRRVPIIDEGGALVGIVAFDDLVGHVAEQTAAGSRARARHQL